MSVNVLIDGYDIGEVFGLRLQDGGLDVFELPPIIKEPFFNDWPDENGRDYDEQTSVVYESQLFEVPFLLICNSMEDYREKKKQFLDLILAKGEVDFQIIDWGEAYRLRYKEIVSWDFINIGLSSKTSARFVIRFENNHGKPSVFKYLMDNTGCYIIINNNKKVMVKTTY